MVDRDLIYRLVLKYDYRGWDSVSGRVKGEWIDSGGRGWTEGGGWKVNEVNRLTN